MKRLFLTSIAALLLATGAAHADELSEYGNARNMLPYCKELLDKNHPINHPKHGYCMATISVVVAYLKRSNDCPDFPKEVTLADAIKIVVDSVENFMEKGSRARDISLRVIAETALRIEWTCKNPMRVQ